MVNTVLDRLIHNLNYIVKNVDDDKIIERIKQMDLEVLNYLREKE